MSYYMKHTIFFYPRIKNISKHIVHMEVPPCLVDKIKIVKNIVAGLIFLKDLSAITCYIELHIYNLIIKITQQ